MKQKRRIKMEVKIDGKDFVEKDANNQGNSGKSEL